MEWRGPARELRGVRLPMQPLTRPVRPGCGACADGVAPPFPFTMAFQPVVNILTGAVYAYEALVRGPAGESAGSVLAAVTRENRYAFDQSCRRKAIELAGQLGIAAGGARLSINFIPGAVYESANCIRATLAAARSCNFPLDRITFEVTEGEKVRDTGHLGRIFQEYRRHGFRLALDDVGAGYAGLTLLAELRPDLVKLDRELITGIDQDHFRRAIVGGMVGICRELGIGLVAEGVERRAELTTLRALGVELVQGFLLARPAFEALPQVSIPA